MAGQPEEPNKTYDPFAAWLSLRDASMEAWARSMSQAVNTEAYAQATGAMLQAYLNASAPFREAMAGSMAAALQHLNLPTRADVLSVAERLANIEMRLDDMDAKLDAALQRILASEAPRAAAREGGEGE